MIDLHIHSNYSDGILSPREIINVAAQNQITDIAITDHDSLLAYSVDTINYAKLKGVNLICGVEISTKLRTGFHVLGYNVDLHNAELQATLKKLQNARVDYLHNVSKRLNELGYVIDHNTLKDLPSVTKAHISANIVTNPLNENILIKNFGHIPNKGEFIETIMNENCPAYVEKYGITPMQASKLIHDAGGKVVLAHPVCYKYEDGIDTAIIKQLVLDMQADGLEANYLYVNRDNVLINEIDTWNQVAKELNVFTTIGSDFHTPDTIRPSIGFTNSDLKLSNEEINTILSNLQ